MTIGTWSYSSITKHQSIVQHCMNGTNIEHYDPFDAFQQSGIIHRCRWCSYQTHSVNSFDLMPPWPDRKWLIFEISMVSCATPLDVLNRCEMRCDQSMPTIYPFHRRPWTEAHYSGMLLAAHFIAASHPLYTHQLSCDCFLIDGHRSSCGLRQQSGVQMKRNIPDSVGWPNNHTNDTTWCSPLALAYRVPLAQGSVQPFNFGILDFCENCSFDSRLSLRIWLVCEKHRVLLCKWDSAC